MGTARGSYSLLVLGLGLGLGVGAGCSFNGPSTIDPDAAPDGDPDAMQPDGPEPDGPADPARRKRITIQDEGIADDLDQFPVWIFLPADAELAARASASGADIHFTLPDGTDLPYEIQRWDKATGRLEAWVRMDLEDDQEAGLDLRYGDPAAAHPPAPATVFASSFAAVWHLEDALDGGAISTVVDARGQTNGTASGGLGPAHRIAAQLGRGVDFDGVTDKQIGFQNPYAGGVSHTFSAWVNHRTGTGCDSIVTVGNPQGNRARWLYARHLNGLSAGFFGNDMPGSVDEINGDGWVLIHWTWSSGDGVSRIYRDGEELVNQTLTGANTQGGGGYLGWAPGPFGAGTPCALNGTLDEVRLATTVRTPGWIATEYANQKSPQTFYSVGPEQMVP